MHKRRLGKTDIEISEVGLGAWQLGGDWGAPVSEDGAREILGAALDAGVDFIDTADVYGAGRSERLIGDFLRETGASVTIATKQGRFDGWTDTYDVMKAHAVASIKRLGVERLDLLQLHCIPFDVLKRGEVFVHLEALQREGLIAHAGVSVESVEEGLFCLEQPIVSALQVIYNIFRQKLTTELLPQAAAADVGILARVPLASGLLAGKFDAEHVFAENDHRHFNADGQCFNVGETFAGVPFGEGVALAQSVAEILAPGAETMAQKSLRWVLDDPHVSTVIPGATRTSHATSNAAVSAMSRLSDDQHARLKALYQSDIAAAIRGPY